MDEVAGNGHTGKGQQHEQVNQTLLLGMAEMLQDMYYHIRALLVEPSNPQILKALLRVEKCHILTLLRVEKQGQILEPSNSTRKLL